MIERHTGSWNIALAVWCLPAAAGAVLWAWFTATRTISFTPGRMPRFSVLFGDPTAWYVTGFMGLQAALAFSSFLAGCQLCCAIADRRYQCGSHHVFVDRRSSAHGIIHARIGGKAVPRRGARLGGPRCLPLGVPGATLWAHRIYTDLGSRAWAWSGRAFWSCPAVHLSSLS